MPSGHGQTLPVRLAGRFDVKRKLGSGCFGVVHRGVDVESGAEVAIKVEEATHAHGQLFVEAEVLHSVSKPVMPQGFARLFWSGREAAFNCLVMELLGRSLEEYFNQAGNRFSPKTTALVAEQVLHRIEYLHSKCFVHRDIKPENFMFGVSSTAHIIYIIDFGLSKAYCDKRGRHAPLRQKLSLTGTARYASITAHEGFEQSRRDDLEAIGHMFMYFLRGSLPWSGLDARTKDEKYRKIMEKKKQVPLQELCDGHPPEFADIVGYARGLDFKERPDYDLLQGLLKEVKEQQGAGDDCTLPWLEGMDQAKISALVPLEPRSAIEQPDDQSISSKKSGDRRRKLIQCFCGGRGKEITEAVTTSLPSMVKTSMRLTDSQAPEVVH